MEKRINNCDDVTICNWKDLLANWRLLDKKLAQWMCAEDCAKRKDCFNVLTLLEKGKLQEATEYLKNSKDDLQRVLNWI